jgi:hypothetical protein
LRFHFQAPRHIQALSEEQKSARIAFWERLLEWDDRTLESICFSDQSLAVLGNDNRWPWHRRGEDNTSETVPTVKFPASLMVFEAIGMHYRSRLLVIEGSISTDKYIENCSELGFIEELDSIHRPLEWTFQQDGAPCHTTRKAIDWLEESCEVIQELPSNSPDLPTVEMIWSISFPAVA